MENEIEDSKSVVAYAKEKMPSEEIISDLSDFFKNCFCSYEWGTLCS